MTEGEKETLDLFTHSDAARQAVDHARKVAQLTGPRKSREIDPDRRSQATSDAA